MCSLVSDCGACKDRAVCGGSSSSAGGVRVITNETVGVVERFVLTVTDLHGRETLWASDDYDDLRGVARTARGAGRADIYDSAEDELHPLLRRG